jgi:preprotein translocase subunit SecD
MSSMSLDDKNIYLISYRDSTDMDKLKQIREDRIKFVETTLEDAKRKEEDLTSKEIQALKKLIDGNIQIIRSHSDKIISLSSNEPNVYKAIKGNEKRILDIHNRLEMVLSII